MKQSIKLIVIIFILCLCGTYPVKADDDYTLQSVYSVEPSTGTSIMPQVSMPEVHIYPTLSSPSVSNTLVLTNDTRWLLTEQIRYEESLHNTYITPDYVQGNKTGWITSYSQRITYTNTKSDMYEAHLNIIESLGGTGVVTIYVQKNNEWVQVAVDNFENTYTTGDLVPSSAITGWRFDVVYTLNYRFRFFYTVNVDSGIYANGYKLNSIGLNIVDPSEEEEEETNGLLNTIKSAIDNVKNAIDDVITGITNLPGNIANGLKGFFDNIKDAIDDVITGITNLPGRIANSLKSFFDNIKDAIDDVITGITNLPGKIANGLKGFFDNIKDAIDVVITGITNLPGKIANALKGFFDNIKDAIDDVITGITNLPGLIMDGLKALFIPTDFYGDLETAMNDIIDALGVVGYPISLYTKTCYVVRDTTSTSLTVDVPAFYYKGQTIFPRYHRDNIFYFQNKLVFENVQKTTWMRQFFGMFNADIDTITIGNLVKTLMSVLMWFGIISFIIRIYNKAFGLDVNEEMGDDDE